MKRLAPTLVLLFALAPLAGCDGDDPTSPAGSSGPSLFLMGSMQVRDGVLEGFLEFWDVTSSGARVDSVRIGDALVVTDFEHDYYTADDAYWGTGLGSYGVEDFAAGDTVTVQVFVGDEVGTVDLVLLERAALQMAVTPVDPLPAGAAATFGWVAVEGADFYGVTVRFTPAGDDPSTRTVVRDYVALEPPFTLPQELTAREGDLSVRIASMRGPVPTAEGVVPANVETTSLRGQIWSSGPAGSSRIAVGTAGSAALAPPTAARPALVERSGMAGLVHRSWR